MTSTDEQTSHQERLKRALLALQKLRARLDAIEHARTEPIAIVGVGCRFPGEVHDPEAFWHMLRDGRDVIVEVPAERWEASVFYDPDPMAPGKIISRCGGFLSDIDRFDASFFGITPREAVHIDPQQRLLLEVVWEALEHAGQAPDQLFGRPSGVFIGMCNSDYQRLQLVDLTQIDAYIGTGTALSVAAGRVSYTLGL